MLKNRKIWLLCVLTVVCFSKLSSQLRLREGSNANAGKLADDKIPLSGMGAGGKLKYKQVRDKYWPDFDNSLSSS
jgi:hypothetical protein